MATFVAGGSEPTAGEAGRSGEGGPGGFPPTTITQFTSAESAMSAKNVSSTSAPVRAQAGKCFVARGSEPPARQAKRSGKRMRGVAAPTCDSKILKRRWQAFRCPR
jgi:hypothetical protein